MYSIEEEEMVFCPYNRYHIVSKLRLQKHIIKCKKQHSDVKLATCFYNYSHRVKPEDMLEHYEICSHKTRIDGSRYYCEPFNKVSNTPEKGDPFLGKCPNIDIKPKILTPPDTFPAPSQLKLVGAKKYMLDLESESDHQMAAAEKKLRGIDLSHGDSTSNDSEPVPLSKTGSKAFESVMSNAPLKGFGRGKNFSYLPPRRSRPTDHLLPCLNNMENEMPSCSKISIQHFPKDISCSASITSSMFDDATFVSEEVIFDEDFLEDCKSDVKDNDGLGCIEFDKYKKI